MHLLGLWPFYVGCKLGINVLHGCMWLGWLGLHCISVWKAFRGWQHSPDYWRKCDVSENSCISVWFVVTISSFLPLLSSVTSITTTNMSENRSYGRQRADYVARWKCAAFVVGAATVQPRDESVWCNISAPTYHQGWCCCCRHQHILLNHQKRIISRTSTNFYTEQ